MTDLNLSWNISLLVATDLEAEPKAEDLLALIWGDEAVELTGQAALSSLVPPLFEQSGFKLSQAKTLVIDQDFISDFIQEPEAERAADPLEALDEALPASQLVAVAISPATSQIGFVEIRDGSVTQRLWFSANQADGSQSTEPKLCYQGKPSEAPANLIGELDAEADASAKAMQEGLLSLCSQEPETGAHLLEAWALGLLDKALGFNLADAPASFWDQSLAIYEPA